MAAVDGRGTARVAAAMWGAGIQVRPALPQDCEQMHIWRNAPAVRAASRNDAEIPLAEHRRWFEAVLASRERVLLVGEDARGAVGVVRFDLEASEAEVSIYLATDRHGQGLGPGLLHAAEAWLTRQQPAVKLLRAEVLAGNDSSSALFEEAGYLPASRRYCKRTGNA
jgi:RimJ/RimL family protein N-acetyltransferase